MRRSVKKRSVMAAAILTAVAVGCVPQPGPGGGNGGGGNGGGGNGGGNDSGVEVIATGLNGPYGLASSGGRLYVAEGDAGQITRINPRNGQTTRVVDGLSSPAGVAVVGRRIVSVTGGAMVPDASIMGDSTVFTSRPGDEPTPLADLEAYELANNPDGQLQFDPETGEALDALSNPFAMIARRGPGLVLVADGGANDVLSVAEDGTVSTFFVPPVINTGACEGRPNNDPAHTGCDPVPTGLAYGPNNAVYVSTLQGEAPGEGRVYILDGTTGAVRDVLTGFDSPTGVAVAPNGTVYVSEVLFGAPEGDGPPPDGFDPSTIGRIVRVTPDGARSYASVTMPTGLFFEYGKLYASAWSIASFFGIADAGQVVAVSPKAFVAAPAD